MFIKIVRSYGSNENVAPEFMFEAQTLQQDLLEEDTTIDDSTLCLYDSEKPFVTELWLDNSTRILLNDAIVYIMNNDGKTIDSIAAN